MFTTIKLKAIVLYTILSCFCGFSGIYAQTPQIISTAPENNITGVSLTTNIEVKVNFPIAQNKIFNRVPLVDTVPPNNAMPCIYIVPKIYYDSLGGNTAIIKKIAFHGSFSFLNDTTIRLSLQSNQLLPGYEYKVLVDDLSVIRIKSDSSGFDTLTISPYTFTFTTEPPTHRVVLNPLWFAKTIRRGDTVRIALNRPITSTSTVSGDIVSLKKVVSTTQTSEGYVYNYQSLTSELSLESSGKTIVIVPPVLSKDIVYRLTVNLSYLTGNGNDDDISDFRVKDKGTVKMSIVPSTPSVTIPSSLTPSIGTVDRLYEIGDTLRVSVPTEYGSLYFVKWQTDNFPSLNNNIIPSINRVIDYSNVSDFNLQAVYAPMSKDTFEFEGIVNNSNATFKVINFADSLGGGVYTAYRRNNNPISIVALPNSGKAFSSWKSINYPSVNGITSQALVITPSNIYNLPGVKYKISFNDFIDIGQIGLETCLTYRYNINVLLGGVYGGEQIDPNLVITSISHPLTIWSQNTPGTRKEFIERSTPIDEPFFMTIDPCYELKYVMENGAIIGGAGNNPSQGGSISNNNDLAHRPSPQTFSHQLVVDGNPFCQKTLTVQIRKKSYLLTIDYADKNNADISVPEDVRIDRVGQGEIISQGYLNGEKKLYRQVVKYFCDEVVTLTPKNAFNDQAVITGYNWVCGNGYYCGNINPTTHSHQIIMSEDRTVKYLWESKFKLVSISVPIKSNNTNTMQEFSVDNKGRIIQHDEFAKNIVALDVHRNNGKNTCKIQLKFNDDVYPSTLYDGNLRCSDILSERMDCKDYMQYDYKSSDVCSGNIVTMSLVSNYSGYSQVNQQEFKITTTSNIRSSSFQQLSNPSTNNTATRLPRVQVVIDDVKLKGDFDAWGTDADIRLVSSVAFANVDGNGTLKAKDENVKVNITDKYSMDEDDTKPIGSTVSTFDPESKRDVLTVGYHAIDTDSGFDMESDWDYIADVMKKNIEKEPTNLWWIGGFLAAKIAAYASGDDDEDMGSAPYHEHSWAKTVYGGGAANGKIWGGNSCNNNPYSLQHTANHSNYEVKYTINLIEN